MVSNRLVCLHIMRRPQYLAGRVAKNTYSSFFLKLRGFRVLRVLLRRMTPDSSLGRRDWILFVMPMNKFALDVRGGGKKKRRARDYNLPETWKVHCRSPSMLFHSSSEVPGKGEEERQKCGVPTGEQPKHRLWLGGKNQLVFLADGREKGVG